MSASSSTTGRALIDAGRGARPDPANLSPPPSPSAQRAPRDVVRDEGDVPAAAAAAAQAVAQAQLVVVERARLVAEAQDQAARVELRRVAAILAQHPEVALRLPGVVEAAGRADVAAHHANIIGTLAAESSAAFRPRVPPRGRNGGW